MKDAALFRVLCPPETERVSRPVVFALDGVLLAAVVEAEDFVIKIEELRHGTDATRFGKEIAHLGIDLGVRVNVGVGLRPFNSARGGSGWVPSMGVPSW